MKKTIAILLCFACLTQVFSQTKTPQWNTQVLGYHPIQTNPADKSIVPWYSTDLGKSYDFVINHIWQFWDTMRTDMNGLPYYMNHQVWKEGVNDPRGVGGDQFAMALSSWQLYYQYSGNERVKENMKFITDYYLTHSLSPETAKWPNLPYPYNTLLYSGVYDGDMVIGRYYTQPDKAGSFGYELVKLNKMVGTASHGQTPTGIYLETAVKIANTLAQHTQKGDNDHSPLPFKVNALTGEIGKLSSNSGDHSEVGLSAYTSNWSATMELFLSLIELKAGNTALYQQAFDTLLSWMKQYPLKTNKWGPFFEDIPGWSDTQINAITFAQFMMNHPEYFPNWQQEVKGIFDWVYANLGNNEWKQYGVVVVHEQTAYTVPGNSHSSRQASAELQYAALTGDTQREANAIRQLNWATYMVDVDGKNCYPRDENWLTDGYGDYVRHYLRAMAAYPQLAPSDQNHLLFSTSMIQQINYTPELTKFLVPVVADSLKERTQVYYRTFDEASTEHLRMPAKPGRVLVNDRLLPESGATQPNSWYWKKLEKGGVVVINKTGHRVLVLK